MARFFLNGVAAGVGYAKSCPIHQTLPSLSLNVLQFPSGMGAEVCLGQDLAGYMLNDMKGTGDVVAKGD